MRQAEPLGAEAGAAGGDRAVRLVVEIEGDHVHRLAEVVAHDDLEGLQVPADFDFDAALLAQFAPPGFVNALADLDHAAGNGPAAGGRFVPALHKQRAPVFDDQHANGWNGKLRILARHARDYNTTRN